jgi:ribosomal protein S18 acetylase RimI-like enzyme
MERRAIRDDDRPAIAEFIEQRWHSRKVISQGKAYLPHEEEGFIDWRDGKIAGLLTYVLRGDEMEMLTLDSTIRGHGIGSALCLMAIERARKQNVRLVSLCTTNDNLNAIGYYQRMGFRLVKVNVGAVDRARAIKPEIPEIGHDGIPIHDEVIMELSLKPATHNEE